MRLLMRIWYMIVGEPCSGNAVKSMEKSLRKLDKAAEFQAAKKERMKQMALAANEAAVRAAAEADRASRVRGNLAGLLER
jgi:hypothetical protein